MAEYKRHHDKRMAGDVFPEGSEFRDGVEKRYGKERYADLAAPGMQEAHVGSSGTERYSGAEVRAEVREGGMDADYYRKLRSEGAKFNGNAQDFLYDTFGLNFQGGPDKKKPAVTPEAPEESEPVNEVITEDSPDQTIIPGSPVIGIPGMSQNVNQDNDIVTTIKGDGNTVENQQDNSIKQMSGGEKYLSDWMKQHNFFSN